MPKSRFVGLIEIVYIVVTTTRSGLEGSRGGRLCGEESSDEIKKVTIVTAVQHPPRACSLVTFLQEQESHAPRSGANRLQIRSFISNGHGTP